MGKIQKEIPVKLICGFIFSKEDLFKNAAKKLAKKFGKIDFVSVALPFDYTNYYEKEIGKDLLRKFISFQNLISPARLSPVKLFTNKLEKTFSVAGSRQINIDPGYVSSSKLVLATTKDYSHRIYLSKGIFVEITLEFKGNGFMFLPWTYPDYKTDSYRQIFNKVRSKYLTQVRPFLRPLL